LGPPVDPSSLTRLPPPVDERGVLADGRQCLRAEVVWVDRFGNVKLSVVVDETLARAFALGSQAELSAEQDHPAAPVTLRAVRAFTDLSDGELGAMADADGHLAIVAPQRSAALQLDLGVGDLVELWW